MSHILTPLMIEAQARWSNRTFGPGTRLKGIVKHIEKELMEVLADPGDAEEWADLLVLVIDGATRQGISGERLLRAYHRKMQKNRRREWPTGGSQDEPIEHVKSAGETVEVSLEDMIGHDAMERWGAYEPDDGEAVAELQKVVHEKFREPMCGWPRDGRRGDAQ